MHYVQIQKIPINLKKTKNHNSFRILNLENKSSWLLDQATQDKSWGEFLPFQGLVTSYGRILQAKASISATQQLQLLYLSVACSFKVAKN